MRKIPGFLITCIATIGLAACWQAKKPLTEPAKEAGWEKIGPGGGGATFIPTFSYHNPQEFLLRCDMTGTYFTKDGGQSFTQLNFDNGASGFAFDPQDSNTIYIGSAVLHRSRNGGRTWETLFPGREEIVREGYSGDHASYAIRTRAGSLYEGEEGAVANIRVDPVQRGSLYFSMGNYFFHSRDDGQHWQKENCESRIQFIYTNNSSLKNQVLVFTATEQFIFDKSSGALVKKELPLALSPAFSFTGGASAAGDRVILYALHQDPREKTEQEFGHTETWMSADIGLHWTAISNEIISNKATGIKPSYSMIACPEFDAEKAWLVTNRYEERKENGLVYWYGALKTADAGRNWQWVWQGGGGSGQYGVKDGIGVSNLRDAWVEKAFGGEYIRLMDVGVSPKDGNTAIVTDWYRTMKTTDGGRTWDQVYSKPQADSSYTTNGLDVTTCYGVHPDPFDSNHIAISYTDIGYHHTLNGGKSWIRSTAGVPTSWVNTCYWVVFDPAVKNKLWSAWSGMHDLPRGKMTRNPQWKEMARGGICISVDGGKTWTPGNDGMGFDSPTTCIVLDPASPRGSRTLYASVFNKGVFKSTDDGRSWTLKNRGIDANTNAFELTLTPKGDLYLVVSPTPVHKGGKPGREIYPGALYKSTDGAETWQKLTVTDGLLFPNGVEYDPANPERLYLACWAGIERSDLVGGDIARSTGGNDTLKTPGGIFRSEDGGRSWQSIFDSKQYVYDVTADPRHPGRLYANTFNGAAYRSEDGGNSWQKIRGYDFHWGHRAIIDRNDPEKIYLTTYGSSVWHGYALTE